ncbi:putative cation efflux family protein [Peziza echinospora]|nr:putative cation efflux family protein [Peziza echinospora]
MASSARDTHDSNNHHGHSHDDPTHTHSHSGLSALTHSHSHSPNENIYLTSKNTRDAGVRITRIGLLVNLLMAVFKGLGGYYFNSQALVADAYHSLTDLVSDFLTLSTVALALRRPSERFPNGFGKIESLGSLGVSGLLLVGGLAMGYNAVEHLYAEFFFENAKEYFEHAHSHGHGGHGHSHSHAHMDLGPNINAAWIALGSILVKEWLYRTTMKIAIERKSSVLASNAVHHRIDSLTSVVALLAIGGSHLLNHASWLDPIGGLLVSLMVVSAGFKNTKTAILELADVGLDSDVKQAITEVLGEGGVEGVKDVGGVKSGQNYLVEVVLEVDGGETLRELARTEERVRSVLMGSEGRRKARGVRRVKVRFVERGRDFVDEFLEGSEDEREVVEEKARGKEGKKGI